MKKYIFAYFISALFGSVAFAQQKNSNYIQTTTYTEEQGADSLYEVQYFDSYGRPICAGKTGFIQQTQIYTSQIYDCLGRTVKAWLPTSVVTSEVQNFNESWMDSESTKIYNDPVAYTQTRYDVLNRPILELPPGIAYSYPNTKGTQYKYGVNTDQGFYTVRRYEIEPDGSLDTSAGTWERGMLQSTTTTDADGRIAISFKDDRGLTLLERRIIEKEDVTAQQNDIYYVYDNVGRLVYVLPPQCQQVAESDMNKYWYKYRYDSCSRIITKNIPGCDSITYAYDSRDRVAQMQDGEMRLAGLKREYSYDNLNRLTKQSLKKVNSTNSNPGNTEVENFYDFYDKISYSGLPDSDAVFLQGPVEERVEWGKLLASKQFASNGELLMTLFFYDNKGRVKEQRSIGLNRIRTIYTYEYDYLDNIISETCQRYEKGTLVLTTILENQYKSHHQLLAKSYLTFTDKDGKSNRVCIQSLLYNSLGNVARLERAGELANVDYGYDLLHGRLKSITSSGGFEQHLYRESGGDNQYYNGSIAAMTWKCGADDVEHRYDYLYDGLNRLTEAIYQSDSQEGDELGLAKNTIGLIPSAQTSVPVNRYGESMEYDMNSNITSLQRRGMLNNKTFGLIDDLSIEYNGNQRVKVTDAVEEVLNYEGASDFVDEANSGAEYAYNANGALTMDLNKGITNIEYDLLGNIKKITMTGNRTIEYVYAADGTRLRTIHSKPKELSFVGAGDPTSNKSSGKTILKKTFEKDSTDYCGNLILKNTHLSQYLFAGGYASFDADTLSGWHYYIQDYMGNNRMVVNALTNEVEQINHYYPYGGIIGNLSTNQETQKYKFEGKELDRSFGLDWYDIQARQYDAIVPVWNGIDQLAGKYYHISPYVMCAGNPVNLGDYDGRDIYKMNNRGFIFFVEKSSVNTLVVDHNGERVPLTVKDNSVLQNLSVKKHEMKKMPIESEADVKNGFENIRYDARHNVHKSNMDSEQVKELFEFVTKYSDVEWHVSVSNDGTAIIGTEQDLLQVGDYGKDMKGRTVNVHNHNTNERQEAGANDMKFADPNAINLIYYPETGDYIKYTNKESNAGNVINVRF